MATLKEQIRAIQKDRKVEFRNEKKKAKRMSGAMPGSCRARVDEVLIDTELENGAPDYTLAAEAAYDWFNANGAQFFHTLQGEPFMYFDNAIYWMDSPDRGRKRITRPCSTSTRAWCRPPTADGHFRGTAQPGDDPWPGARPFFLAAHRCGFLYRLFQSE